MTSMTNMSFKTKENKSCTFPDRFKKDQKASKRKKNLKNKVLKIDMNRVASERNINFIKYFLHLQ